MVTWLPRFLATLLGRFPFNQKVWFEFPATFSSEWNSFFQKFLKERANSRGIPKFSETFPLKFSFSFKSGISRILYSVEWFTFRTFNSFLNPWNLFQVISIPFATVSKFSKFLVGKRPRLPFFLTYGAPLRAKRAGVPLKQQQQTRKSSYSPEENVWQCREYTRLEITAIFFSFRFSFFLFSLFLFERRKWDPLVPVLLCHIRTKGHTQLVRVDF